jgi:ABC-2 type transport system permease protein
MRSLVIAGRLIRQIGGDKRTLGIIMIAPIFILFILNVVLTSGVTKARLDVINETDAGIAVLEESAVVTKPSDEEEAMANLRAGRTDAYVVIRKQGGDKLVIEGSDPTLTGLVKATYAAFLADRTMKAMQGNAAFLAGILDKIPDEVKGLLNLPDFGAAKPEEPDIETLYGGDFDFFDTIAAGIMSFIVFFLVFLLSGIAFLWERISGTLERTMASSIRRWEIVAGYLLGFGVFVVVQTVLIQSFLIYVLQIHYQSTFWAILAVNLLAASTSLALGALLSAFARNEFQLIQFIPIVIIPQVLFSGLFDLRDAPGWVNWLSQIFPLTYASRALKEMMIRGRGLGDVWVDLLVLFGFTALFMFLNIIALKKYRKA